MINQSETTKALSASRRIYIFFVVLPLLYWNPVTYYLLYNNTPRFNKIILLFFVLVFIGGALTIMLINKNKLGKKWLNISFSISFLGILYILLLGVNGLAGRSIRNMSQQKPVEGLIFEPNTSAHYHTSEFDYTVQINSLGLRNEEVNVEKKTKRILCFGDSWTFGWGVDLKNSWPKQMAAMFENDSVNIEVINCGKGGDYPGLYRKYMEKAVPLLKPDIVIVGLLQLDDLAQFYETNYTPPERVTETKKKNFIIQIGEAFAFFFKKSFSNIPVLAAIISKNKEKDKAIDISSEWKRSAKDYLNNMSELQYKRYCSFDDSVKYLFENGQLNPGLVGYYINYAERGITFNDPNDFSTKFACSELIREAGEMKKVCDANHAELVFANMPTAEFTGHNVVRTPANRIIRQWLFTNNKVDSMYRSVAEKTNVRYIELTERFKMLPDKSAYFYIYDGHPNPKGYGEIAAGIHDYIKTEFKINN